jgi:hypothetical protein
MALHTSTLTMTPADFLNPNMADIWIGILSQRQQTGMVAIKRSGDWIRFEPTSSSIYATYRNRDLRQTEVVNSIAPWVLWAQKDFERQSSRLQETEAWVTAK